MHLPYLKVWLSYTKNLFDAVLLVAMHWTKITHMKALRHKGIDATVMMTHRGTPSTAGIARRKEIGAPC
jgi:hypothetical protein